MVVNWAAMTVASMDRSMAGQWAAMTVELMVARMVDCSAVQWGQLVLLKEKPIIVL